MSKQDKKSASTPPPPPPIRFKQDDGSDFPDWQERRLGELCCIKTGKLDANAMVKNGKYRFYTCAKDFFQIDTYEFDTDALIISGNGANVGYIHHFNGKFNAYQRTYVLDGFTDSIYYIRHFLDKYLYKIIYKEKREGVTPYIVMSTLTRMKIKLPSLPEQQKIASFLQSVDTKIQLLERKVVLLQSYKKGVMQKLFSQELRFKDEQGNEYPDWEEKRLGEILEYEQPTKYIVDSSKYSDNYSIPVLTAGKTFILGYTNETYGVFTNHPVIIFDDFTTVSKFVDFDFKVKSSAMKILKLRKNVQANIKLIYECMQKINFSLKGHKRYWISEYQHITISFPSFLEQQKIASFLQSLDTKISLTQKQVVLTKLYKKGLLQRMFV